MGEIQKVERVLDVLVAKDIRTLDLTGGAPELNPHFRDLVREARGRGVHVIDRCNLTILSEPGQEDLAGFLAAQGVQIVASLPCYLEDNVDRQRGAGVFQRSVDGLRRLNGLGYGRDGRLPLSLVYNPQGPSLPPPQQALETDYRQRFLGEPGQEDLAQFLAAERVEVVASLPCYLEDNVGRQRGKGAFEKSIRALRRLNALGYGREGSALHTFTITINAPPLVSIVRPADGSVYPAPGTITVVIDAMDLDGEVTHVALFEKTILLATFTEGPYVMTWTNVPPGSYEFRATATDNHEATSVSDPVRVAVVDSLPLVAGPIIFNPQSGLFEQRVTVTNNTMSAVSAIRVFVLGLTESVQVYNASGTQNGIPYVQYNQTLERGTAVTLVIEYYNPKRIAPNPTFIAQVVPSETPIDPNGTFLRITRQAKLADGSFMIEFVSVKDRIHWSSWMSRRRR